jgi:hypothetical protein
MAWEQASGRKDRYFKIRPYHSPFIGSNNNNAYIAISGGAQCFAQPQSLMICSRRSRSYQHQSLQQMQQPMEKDEQKEILATKLLIDQIKTLVQRHIEKKRKMNSFRQ